MSRRNSCRAQRSSTTTSTTLLPTNFWWCLFSCVFFGGALASFSKRTSSWGSVCCVAAARATGCRRAARTAASTFRRAATCGAAGRACLGHPARTASAPTWASRSTRASCTTRKTRDDRWHLGCILPKSASNRGTGPSLALPSPPVSTVIHGGSGSFPLPLTAGQHALRADWPCECINDRRGLRLLTAVAAALTVDRCCEQTSRNSRGGNSQTRLPTPRRRV